MTHDYGLMARQYFVIITDWLLTVMKDILVICRYKRSLFSSPWVCSLQQPSRKGSPSGHLSCFYATALRKRNEHTRKMQHIVTATATLYGSNWMALQSFSLVVDVEKAWLNCNKHSWCCLNNLLTLQELNAVLDVISVFTSNQTPCILKFGFFGHGSFCQFSFVFLLKSLSKKKRHWQKMK